MTPQFNRLWWPAVLCAAIMENLSAAERVTFDPSDGRMEIRIDGQPFAEYVWQDKTIPRPYFRQVHAPGGLLVTRHFPPRSGQDATDHATMHPGLWMSFGDLSGADFWRNRAETRWEGFSQAPRSNATGGEFSVRLTYRQQDEILCREECRIHIVPTSDGTLLDWTSTFHGDKPFHFGDQEEMGLAVRLATPLTVQNGGRILNSRGQKNELEVWGQTAEWCDYSGQIDGKLLGILLMPDPKNFRPAWFHVRNAGLMAANPFGRNAFTKGERSVVTVPPGERFQLRFGVLLHSGEVDPARIYEAWRSPSP